MKLISKAMAVAVFLVFAIYGLTQFIAAYGERQFVSDAHQLCETHGGIADMAKEDTSWHVLCADGTRFDEAGETED